MKNSPQHPRPHRAANSPIHNPVNLTRRWPLLCILIAALVVVFLATRASAFVAADSDTIFNAYNNAFYVANGGNAHYKLSQSNANPGYWTLANQIEMAEDVYDRTGSTGTRDIVSALCNGFVANNGTSWSWNTFNDDIQWACIAFIRAYFITGNTAFRDRAKQNWDLMYARGYSTSLGGGIFWNTSNGGKNACSNGPAIIGACYLYQATGDASYLTKAQNLYTWLKNTLTNPTTGAVYDGIDNAGNVNTGWIFTYNQGTFIGSANFLYKLTGTRSYYQDALRSTLYVKNSMCNAAGIFPPSTEDGGDGTIFNAIGFRWIAKFVKDQNLWGDFYPWLKANADAAWNVRRTSDNLSWCDWTTTTAAGTRSSAGCCGSVVALQVVPPVDPTTWFMIVNRGTGGAVDLIGGATGNGSVTNQWAYDYNGQNQRWALIPTEAGDHYKLISLVSRKSACTVLDSLADGAQIHAWDYTGNNPAQQWDLVDAGNGFFKIRNVKSGKLLEVENGSTANNTKIQQWADDGGTNQHWRLQPWGDYFIKAASGRYICVQGMGSTNGALIIQYDRENNPWFKWRFESVGDGNYKLSSLNALTRVLSVVSGSTANAANTNLWDYNAANNYQKVRIKPLLNGKFKFYFVHTGMSWDIPGGATGNNINLQQYPDNGFTWQQFSLERVP